MSRKFWLLLPILLAPLRAQEKPDQEKLLQEVLRRLDNLERENRELLEQVRELKQLSEPQHAANAEPATNQPAEPAPLSDRVKINEERIAEQSQTKVESAQKLPVWLSGTLLFNAFINKNDGSPPPGQYGLLSGPGSSGATLRQTLLGLDFQGPSLPGGGHVEGGLAMDFWAGPSAPSSNWLRIRRAGISLTWPNNTVFFGQDKPLISPYEPNSYAEVGIPSMAGSGNLWLWLPQARLGHTIQFSSQNGVDAQVALLQVGSYLNGTAASSPIIYSGGVRPAFEARLAFWHKGGESRNFEIAAGFHISSNHVGGSEITSRIGSVDWLYKPLSKLEFKGTGYFGENVSSLGSLGNGFYQNNNGSYHPVVSRGGWTQLSVPLTGRLTINGIAGLESDQKDVLANGSNVARNASFAGNVMFHLTSNMLFSIEAQRLWTRTFAGQPDTYNHYDLAVAYLF